MSGIPGWVSERVLRGDFATEAEVLEAAGRALDAVWRSIRARRSGCATC
jgi:hypothetical protein